MKIVFLLSNYAASNPIDVDNLYTAKRSLTGSEISPISLAFELAKDSNNDIYLFSNFIDPQTKQKQSKLLNNIKFDHIDNLHKYKLKEFDKAIAYLDPQPLQHFNKTTLRVLVTEVTDLFFCQGFEKYTDIITSLSLFHRDHLKKLHNTDFGFGDNWKILPNGCNPDDYIDCEKSNNAVYCSSADRGLFNSLHAMLKIKKQVPEACLNIYYNFMPFYNSVKHMDNEFGKRMRYCYEFIKKFEKQGVVKLCDSVSRNEMKNVLNKAKINLYGFSPIAETETFSNSFCESICSYTPVVCTKLDCFDELYGELGTLTPNYKDHQDEFVELAVRLYKDKEFYRQKQLLGRELSLKYSWSETAKKLIKIINNKE